MQLLKHVANAMHRAEGFVLERALVTCNTETERHYQSQLTMLSSPCRCFVFPLSPGGVSCLPSTTGTVFTSPGGVCCLAYNGIHVS